MQEQFGHVTVTYDEETALLQQPRPEDLLVEQLLELGGIKKDVTFLVISGIAVICSLLKWNPLPFDMAWVTIVLCGIPIILEAVMTTIKLNMTFSMTLNFIAIALAIIGTLNPVAGALVHNAGSVLVITDSAFLLKWRKK